MNVLNLINQRLDNYYQIKTKSHCGYSDLAGAESAELKGMFGLYPGQVTWAFELPVTCLLRLAKLSGQAYSDFIVLFG